MYIGGILMARLKFTKVRNIDITNGIVIFDFEFEYPISSELSGTSMVEKEGNAVIQVWPTQPYEKEVTEELVSTHTMIISYEPKSYLRQHDDDKVKDDVIREKLRTKAYEIIRHIKRGNLMQ